MRCAFLHLGREHLGLEALSAALKAEGHVTRAFVDGDLFGSEDNLWQSPFLRRFTGAGPRLLEELREWDPRCLFLSPYASTLTWCLDMAAAAKARAPRSLPVVVGGAHARLVPEVLAADPRVDAVLVGEGDLVVGEIVARIEAGLDPHGLPGVWTRGEDGEVRRGGVAPRPRDLDRLGPPDKDLFLDEMDPRADYLIMAGRGCPHRCTFCCEHVYAAENGPGHVRRRSVDGVLAELVTARRRWKPQRVRFLDPVLMADRPWFLELMARYRREVAIPFRCFGHLGHVDEEIVRALVRGGCVAVEFGVQTMEEGLRRALMPGAPSPERVEAALAVCDRAGLRYEVDHILGLPGETAEGLARAARTYARCRCLTRVKPHNLQPFPGTILFRELQARGRFGEGRADQLVAGRDPGGFFHGESPALDGAGIELRRFHRRLLRILPLLPPSWVDALLRGRGRALLMALPRASILLLQLLASAVAGDLRVLTVLREWAGRARARCFAPWRVRSLRLPARASIVPPEGS